LGAYIVIVAEHVTNYKERKRQSAWMPNSCTSNNNKKSHTHSLTINHITIFIPKIDKKQNISIEWVTALYRMKKLQ